MAVHFEDNSMQVRAALDAACIAFLHEAGGELEAQTKRNMPSGHWYAQQSNNWSYRVDESKGECTVGNPLEQSLWTEFGTGEYSIAPQGGRKGYWVYVKGSDGVRSRNPKNYTLTEAKRIVAMMRSDGLNAYYTKGQRPHRPLQKAFDACKNAIIRRAEQILNERLGN